MSDAAGVEHQRTIEQAVHRLTQPVELPIELDDGTTTYGLVPSLWDQAADAVATGDETAEGGIGRRHERSPIDLDLMEMRSVIVHFVHRELLRMHEQHGWNVGWDEPMPDKIQALAAAAITWEKTELDFWAYRFAQWARLLANYLTPVNRGRRLRAPCPRCGTARVEVDTTTGPVMAHPIYVHFGSDGLIRAAQCQACEAAWFRGDGLLQLAEEVGATPLLVAVVASA